MLSPPSSAWHCQTPAVAGEVPNELTVTLDHLPEAALAPQHGALVSKFSDMGFFVHVGPPHGSHRSALACRSNRHAGALIHPEAGAPAGQFMSREGSCFERSNTFAGRIWSAEKRTPQSKQGRGYLRDWFEEAWRRYLDDEEQEHEPSKSAKILHLRGD